MVLSIPFYILFMAFTLLFFLLLSVAFVITVPFDRNRTVLHCLSRLWTRCYFGIIPSWRVRVEGRENVVNGKPYVVIVNHRSMLDILLMYVLPLEFKWVSKKEVYKWPLFGWVLWMHDDIAIERGTAGAVRKMVRDGRRWLSRGVSVIVFPEGSRSKSAGLNQFREGAFMLAREAGVEILPCVSEGTGTAFNGWKLNFRNKFRLRILPPVPVEEVESTPPKEMARRMYELMSVEYEQIRRKE
ncbi:MAG: 1-acyl-sn-glycerol-3-phosphate acyltransferase [Alistipes sp.]|nr:1-acyl-sn-glycerol-3-phosphate acyltransferase [Alistipes sp.]